MNKKNIQAIKHHKHSKKVDVEEDEKSLSQSDSNLKTAEKLENHTVPKIQNQAITRRNWEVFSPNLNLVSISLLRTKKETMKSSLKKLTMKLKLIKIQTKLIAAWNSKWLSTQIKKSTCITLFKIVMDNGFSGMTKMELWLQDQNCLGSQCFPLMKTSIKKVDG